MLVPVSPGVQGLHTDNSQADLGSQTGGFGPLCWKSFSMFNIHRKLHANLTSGSFQQGDDGSLEFFPQGHSQLELGSS